MGTPGWTRLFVHFDEGSWTPVAASMQSLAGPATAIDVHGEVRAGASIFVLCRSGSRVVIGASLSRQPLEATLSRLPKDRSYRIVDVPVFDIR